MHETTEPRIRHATLSSLLEEFSTGFTGRAEVLGLNGSSDAWFGAGLLANRSDGPPLLVGGRSEAALRRAGQLGDGWLPSLVSPRRYAEGVERVREHAAAATGGT